MKAADWNKPLDGVASGDQAIIRANSFSSSVKNFAPAMLSGKTKAAMKLETTVASPSSTKIHLGPLLLFVFEIKQRLTSNRRGYRFHPS
jgi:hypothetical protein